MATGMVGCHMRTQHGGQHMTPRTHKEREEKNAANKRLLPHRIRNVLMSLPSELMPTVPRNTDTGHE